MQFGLATTNTHKLQEAEACLHMLLPDAHVVPCPPNNDIPETADTFEGNARLKLHAMQQQGIPPEVDVLITEDAGLVIPILAGQFDLPHFPGVHSNRWLTPERQMALFGNVLEPLPFARINTAILQLMQPYTQPAERAAYYVSTLAVWVRKSNTTLTVEGTVALTVATAPTGQNGFGYDPIMIPTLPHTSNPPRTMAQLSPAEKNTLSHRRNALEKLVSLIT